MMSERKKRDRIIKKMHLMAAGLTRKYTRDGENALWDMATEWNNNHPDCEVFLCEIAEDDGYGGVGIMVEDDPYIYSDL